MEKSCHESGCYERVIWACSCINPCLYVCDRHISRHLKTLGEHKTECTTVELSNRQTAEFLPKLKDLLKYLRGYRKSIVDNSNIFIECIATEAKNAILNMRNLEKVAVDLITERSVSKESYEKIKTISSENPNYARYEVENIKERVKNFFGFYDYEGITWKECNEVVFSQDYYEGLLSIDLNTFKKSILRYSPKIGQYSNACKIGQHTYFFHGGSIDSKSMVEAYLINTKEKIFEKLVNGPKKDFGGGSVKKNNKVYIFGGHERDEIPLNTCNAYDLKAKKWKAITPMPKASFGITAAILDYGIILSGYHLDCCYFYSHSTFLSILNLPDCCKVVCEGWIFTKSTLYENQGGNIYNWTSHNVNFSWNRYLWTYCVFKKNQYLYFIDNYGDLMRIDTKAKKLDKIAYT